jgi:uncharacterized protein
MATTLILGASDKPERFSNRALHKLQEHNIKVLLVSPKGGSIVGLECFTSLSQLVDKRNTDEDITKADIAEKIDTITVYINSSLIANEIQQIIKLNPRRVIFNPGTESSVAANMLKDNGIEVVNNCTLVMLDLGSY